MISVNEAFSILIQNTSTLSSSINLNLDEALGYVLYKDVFSPINMPPFRQSAVDGYAVHLHNDHNYTLIGEVKAGDDFHPTLNKGEAVRIFTGAPVPDTANAVIMQELITTHDTSIETQKTPALNQNIRPLGEQIQVNDIALKKGTRLTSAGIGFLASLGITTVTVFQNPSIAIIVTGNELIKAGQPLDYGQIYESNATMLASAAKQFGYTSSIYKVVDDYNSTKQVLEEAISKHDVVLVSGGISVGDYDFVGSALRELEIQELFYKVKQKPGKPLLFGKKENTYIFALPGNPAASLSCFYLYVYPTLKRMSGEEDFKLTKVHAKSTLDYTKKGERAQFLKAIYEDNVVTILEGQNSSMLHTFSVSNALVYIPEDVYEINKNSKVEVILLPTY